MLKCWEENPHDRPTFGELKDTMKEMERKHRVMYLEMQALRRGPQKFVCSFILVLFCFSVCLFVLFSFIILLGIRLVTACKIGMFSLKKTDN